MSKSRDKIIKQLKDAAEIESQLPGIPADIEDKMFEKLQKITPEENEGLWQQFKEELKNVSGEFYDVKSSENAADYISKHITQNRFEKLVITGETLCTDIAGHLNKITNSIQIINAKELPFPLRKTELGSVPVSLVEAHYAIADTGTLVFLYDKCGTSYPHFLSESVFAVVGVNQIVPHQFDLFKRLPEKAAKNMVFVTGPSRTADIEKILILGAHGPRKLTVLLLKE